MEVVATTGAIKCPKLPSNRHHQHTNTQLFTDRTSFLSPDERYKSSEGSKCHIPWTCSPQAHLGSSILLLTINASWLPWGRLPSLSSITTKQRAKYHCHSSEQLAAGVTSQMTHRCCCASALQSRSLQHAPSNDERQDAHDRRRQRQTALNWSCDHWTRPSATNIHKHYNGNQCVGLA